MPPSTIPSTSSAISSPGRRFGSSDQKQRRNGAARPTRHDDSPRPRILTSTPQLDSAHPGDPRWAAAARSDAGEAPRALTPAACLARSADRAELWLSPVRAQRSRTIKLGDHPDFIGIGVAFSPTPSAALRYWNMARQRYCRRLVRSCNTLRVSADPVAKPAARSRAESRGSRPSKAAPGERRTLRWREMDSNFRFPDAPSGRSAEAKTFSSDREFAPLAWRDRDFEPPAPSRVDLCFRTRTVSGT